MAFSLTRRRFAALSLAVGSASLLPRMAGAQETPEALFERLERQIGGRLGVLLRDTGDGREWAHRPDERFPMASTFKALAAGAVLLRVDKGEETLDRQIEIGEGDLVPHAPITERHVGASLTIGELCAATVATSDNPAGNLVLQSLGGPEGFTALLRGLGDDTTRLDRWETALNEATPGDERDTTTPRAMAATLERMALADALSDASRAQLNEWMERAVTGDAKLRAGLPDDWKVGDKTGSGGNGSTNIVAIVTPPARAPFVVAIYFHENTVERSEIDAAMAEIGRSIATL